MNKAQLYDQLINGYYGAHTRHKPKKQRGAKSFMSTVFDNGEVLVQKPVTESGPNAFEEYLVYASSKENSEIDNAANEEYIVYQASQESAENVNPYQEYVVGESLSTEDHIAGMFTETDASFRDEISNLKNQNQNTAMDRLQNSTNSQADPNSASANPEQSGNSNSPSSNQTNPGTSGAPLNAQFPQNTIPANASGTEKTMSEEEELLTAMKSILSGEKAYDEDTRQLIDKQPPPQKKEEEEEYKLPKSNEHKIFDKIAQSMSYANAYDLGDIEIENKFNEFDYIHSVESKPLKAKTVQPISNSQSKDESNAVSQELEMDNYKALDEILTTEKSVNPESENKNPDQAVQFDTPSASDFPPRPTNLRPYTEAEKHTSFGIFTYEPDPTTFGGDGIKVTNNWATENIIPVNIPQLNGKLLEGRVITNGMIHFHRSGATALQQLWQAWEQAGLLNKILTFQGGYAARFIRNTQSRNPRPLSNHAYGTAFDINADWNRFGAEPALVGVHGSVRELVQIANQHGFFWGGHFRSKDGMHFELGHQQ